METITLRDFDSGPMCRDHKGWPAHGDDECRLLAGVRPYSHESRCEADDQLIERGFPFAHTKCGFLLEGGGRRRQIPQETAMLRAAYPRESGSMVRILRAG